MDIIIITWVKTSAELRTETELVHSQFWEEVPNDFSALCKLQI